MEIRLTHRWKIFSPAILDISKPYKITQNDIGITITGFFRTEKIMSFVSEDLLVSSNLPVDIIETVEQIDELIKQTKFQQSFLEKVNDKKT